MSITLDFSIFSYKLATVKLHFDAPESPEVKLVDLGIKKAARFWTRRMTS